MSEVSLNFLINDPHIIRYEGLSFAFQRSPFANNPLKLYHTFIFKFSVKDFETLHYFTNRIDTLEIKCHRLVRYVTNEFGYLDVTLKLWFL